MHAPPKSDVPVASPDTLTQYDYFLFGTIPQTRAPSLSLSVLLSGLTYLIGIPTRFGNFPAQWKAFWDSTGRSLDETKLSRGKYLELLFQQEHLVEDKNSLPFNL